MAVAQPDALLWLVRNEKGGSIILSYSCDISTSGKVEGSALSLREIIRDAGASIVVVANNHPIANYIAAAPNIGFGQANLVMTLDRKRAKLATFMARIFSDMKRGTSMPVAWNQLAPQYPRADHGEGAPETVFLCERGQIAFGSVRPDVAASDGQNGGL